MEHATFVRIVNRLGYLAQAVGRTGCGPGAVADMLCKIAAFDQVHREEEQTFVLAHFVDGNDAWMVQSRSSAGFSAKTPHLSGTSELPAQNHLYRHPPIKSPLPRLVDNPHPAARDLLD